MILKIICYVFIIPFVIWVLDSININSIFKKNKETQAKMLYLVLTIAISYLLVSFIFDIANTSFQ